MNPYEVLAVAQDATEADIKRAYRKLAQKHHPDREGGDEKTFQELQAAYDILSDSVKRAEYDRTGKIRNDDTDYRASATQTVRNIFNFALSSAALDVHRFCVTQLSGTIQNVKMQIQSEKAIYQAVTKYRNRVIRKNEGENLFSEVLEQRLSGMSDNIRDMEKGLKISEMALEMLGDYEHRAPTPTGAHHTSGISWQKGFASIKFLILTAIVATTVLFSGWSNAGDYSYYVKLGAGYKFMEPEYSICDVDGVERVIWFDKGSPISARMEVGVEYGAVTFGLAHYSQWLQGWPVNDERENYKTEVFIDYKFTFGGN